MRQTGQYRAALALLVAAVAATVLCLPAPADAQSPGPVGQSGAWALLFADEFDGASLDTSKWDTCYPDYPAPGKGAADGCRHRNSRAGVQPNNWYLPENVTVSDGHAILRAVRRDYVGTDGMHYRWTSGMLSTGGRIDWGAPRLPTFQCAYCYVEMRVRFASENLEGFNEALWGVAAPNWWKPEIDIAETLARTSRFKGTYHWSSAGEPAATDIGRDQLASGRASNGHLGAAFHVYAVDWTNGDTEAGDTVRFLFDGYLFHTVRRAEVADLPFVWFISHQVRSLASNTALPLGTTRDMHVDYVRVFRRAP